ncbi:hypothetical protein DFH09DRAFT_1169906 [Mycena vulgaris]|nr:hypothetical protein DFH09DRAFT_1169906 [Mycena vulgaris]
MASTQQGEAITEWLPNEIITEILEATTKTDQASLCRVSRLFRELCVPVLYRTVQLRHLTGALAFCLALIESPSRGQFIRSFSFYSASPDRMSTSRLLLDSINLMPRLEHLTTHTRELLRTCTVPSLVSCRIGFKSGIEADVLASFLARHPNLTRARVDVYARFGSTPSLPIALPYLERFDGPAYLVPLMLPVVRRLREARLSWGRHLNPSTADIERILGALPSLTSPDIPFFSSYEYPPHLSVLIVTAASIHMPHVKILRLQTRSFELHDIRHITTCLPRFTALAYLALDPPRNPLVMHASSTDQAAVATWANVCPTLEACCLNGSAWRKMDGAWEEYTMQEFEMQAGISDKIGSYVSMREAK